MAAAVAGLGPAMPAGAQAWRALPALPWRAQRTAAVRFCSSAVGRGSRAAPGAGKSSLQRPSWNSRSRRSTSRRTATPRRKPGPPSSDQTAANRSRGSIAQRTPALSPRAPPSP
eukprot:2132909-Alexandrium_andersonii.AAC.1